ncbi:3243_t:CDS:1, partial [Gigaspora margarita]
MSKKCQKTQKKDLPNKCQKPTKEILTTTIPKNDDTNDDKITPILMIRDGHHAHDAC